MKRTHWKLNGAMVLALAGMLVAGQAAADKPSRNDGDHGKKSGHSEQSGKKSAKKSKNHEVDHRDDDKRSSRDSHARVKTGEYFNERHRTVTHEYYGTQFRKGHCPPGLAKKNNGCMPPGQAKKWAVGRPLPRDVVYYEVPQALVVKLERPSSGYRYVRVATDILLIAIGTGMVVDAIQDIGRQ